MELEVGTKIKFLVPVYWYGVLIETEEPTGAIGEIIEPFHDRAPRHPVWFENGTWVALDEFAPDQYEIIP